MSKLLLEDSDVVLQGLFVEEGDLLGGQHWQTFRESSITSLYVCVDERRKQRQRMIKRKRERERWE